MWRRIINQPSLKLKLTLMPNRIQVETIKEDARDQFRFLVRRGFSIDLRNFKKRFYSLTAWTLILLAFVFFTPTGTLIYGKVVFVVLTILAWIIVILFIPFILIHKFRNLRRADKYVESLVKQQLDYFIEFDEDKISFFINDSEVSYSWDHYDYYWEYKSSLYILCEEIHLDSFFFSQNEIGEDNYKLLKEKVSRKLPYKQALF